MPRKKSLATIQEQRKKLEAIERQIIKEMTTEVGEGMLTLFLQDPNNSLWKKSPQLLTRLEELSVAKGKAEKSMKGVPDSSGSSALTCPHKPRVETSIDPRDKPENRPAKFVRDIPDIEL